MQLVRDQAHGAARLGELPVLVIGEPGTEKAQVAAAIHMMTSPAMRMTTVRCRELSGENQGRALREIMDRGDCRTLYVEDIECLSAGASRWFFQQMWERNPSTPRPRLLSSTTSAQHAKVIHGTVMFQTFAPILIEVPPLRERLTDIPILVEHFLPLLHKSSDKRRSVSASSLRALQSHSWPNNIDELKRVLSRCLTETNRLTLRAEDIWQAIAEERGSRRHLSGSSHRHNLTLRELEREVILETFESSGRNISLTSERLGIPRSTLRDKLRRLRLA